MDKDWHARFEIQFRDYRVKARHWPQHCMTTHIGQCVSLWTGHTWRVMAILLTTTTHERNSNENSLRKKPNLACCGHCDLDFDTDLGLLASDQCFIYD